jgi:hypothetical protein
LRITHETSLLSHSRAKSIVPITRIEDLTGYCMTNWNFEFRMLKVLFSKKYNNELWRSKVKSIATKMFSWRDRLDSLLLRNLTILFRVKTDHFVYCHESLLVLCFRDDFSSEMAIVKTFRCNKQTVDYCHEKYKNGR